MNPQDFELSTSEARDRANRSRALVLREEQAFFAAWTVLGTIGNVVFRRGGLNKDRDGALVALIGQSSRQLRLAWDLNLIGYYGEVLPVLRNAEEAGEMCLLLHEAPDELITLWWSGEPSPEFRPSSVRKAIAAKDGNSEFARASAWTYSYLSHRSHASIWGVADVNDDGSTVLFGTPALHPDILRGRARMASIVAAGQLFSIGLASHVIGTATELEIFQSDYDYLRFAYSVLASISDESARAVSEGLRDQFGAE